MKSVLTNITLALCCTLMSLSAAGDPTPQVKSATDKVINYVVDGNGNVKKVTHSTLKKLRDTMGKALNWNVMVQRAMGKNWDKVQPKEQQKIADLTSLLIVKSYTDKISALSGRPSVALGAFKTQGSTRAYLPCTVDLNGRKVSAKYHYILAGDQWVCYDLSIEGASLVSSYRSQFDSHFRRGNGAELIDKFEQKLGLSK